MKKYIYVLICFLNFPISVFSQNPNSEILGTYSDGYLGSTKLTLEKGGTFKLTTPDPVFHYQFERYENRGQWIMEGDKVILNPHKAPREVVAELAQSYSPASDSITISIDYRVEKYQDDSLLSREPFAFDMLSIYINKKKHYHHLVHERKASHCAFAPKIKNQQVVSENNTFRIAQQDLERIGIFSYGFEGIKWFKIEQETANHYHFTVTQPLDLSRQPRSKEVIIKKNKAYFYEKNGEVDTSWMVNALLKER